MTFSDKRRKYDELVSFAYHPQMALDSLSGSATYAQSTRYDAAGRMRQLVRGSGTLTTDYGYYEWDETAMLDGYPVGQGGRLETLGTGSLQGLSYLYDAVGNVRKISNTAPNPDDILDFTYDALDRLLSVRTALSEDYAYDQQGRISSKTGVGTYGYNDSNHEHAVTHLGGVQKYWYDANGNMTTRVIGGSTYNLSYDTENHLTGVSGATTASFVYDGDGNRVKGTVSGATIVYIGDHFEWTSAGNTKYYYHGATRLAMRRSGYASGNGVFFLLGDHPCLPKRQRRQVGSTSLSTDSAGGNPTELRYKPWGETRFSSGTTMTTFRFTGQRQEAALGGADGLYYYGARWYDSALGRFTSPDSIIPDPYNPPDWDRYQYVRSNPLKYVDPDGHFPFHLLPLIGIFLYLASIPGDTGPYVVDPTTSTIGDAGLRMVDPVDWVYTTGECLSGNCSSTDILLGFFLPVLNGGLDDAADAAKALSNADEVVETAGQLHHIFSSKITNALNSHRTLSGIFNREDFVVQGLDLASHNGYEAWHRAYDDEIVEWIENNGEATPAQFLAFMKDLYRRTDMQNRFPDAYKLLEMAEEELQ